MKLKDIIKLCDGPLNIDIAGRSYGYGHEISHIYPYPADTTPRAPKDWLEKETARFKSMMDICGECEVVSLYGFDDGLTIVIKVEK